MVSAELEDVFYPETDNMGEGELQRMICELLRPLLARFLADQGRVAHVGADTFFYFRKDDPSKVLAPDIYVLDGVPQEKLARSYKLWELAAPPVVAIEVVSRDIGKDYDDAPRLHAALGTRELVIFDPEPRSKRRVSWQVYRRSPRGRLELVRQTNADRISCRPLGCWLRAVGEGDALRLRLAAAPRGEVLVPTEAEALAAEVTALRAKLARR
jgi:Uma2 family endonuclease